MDGGEQDAETAGGSLPSGTLPWCDAISMVAGLINVCVLIAIGVGFVYTLRKTRALAKAMHDRGDRIHVEHLGELTSVANSVKRFSHSGIGSKYALKLDNAAENKGNMHALVDVDESATAGTGAADADSDDTSEANRKVKSLSLASARGALLPTGESANRDKGQSSRKVDLEE